MSQPQAAKPSRLSRRSKAILWSAVVVVTLLPALWEWKYAPQLNADDRGQYLMHAEALAEGRPYTDIGYIYTRYASRTGPRIAPPGWPLTLAPLVKLVPQSETPIKLVVLMSLVAFIAVSGQYFARRFDFWLGIATALTVGIALQASVTPAFGLADITFAALIWGVISLIDSSRPWSGSRTALITAAGLAAFLYRTAALPLIPAVFLFAIVRRREQRWRPLVPLLVWSAYFAFSFGALEVGRLPPVPDGIMAQPVASEASPQDPGCCPVVVSLGRRAWNYRSASFESHLYPLPWAWGNDLYHAASSALMLVGLILWLASARRHFLPLFALTYAAMLILSSAGSNRYLWPLFPVLAFALFRGVQWAVQFAFPRLRAGQVTALIAGALAMGALFRQAAGPAPWPLVSHPSVQELFRAVENEDARATVRVGFSKPRTLSWETGVPAMPLFTARPEIVFDELRRQRITHVAVGSLGLRPEIATFWRGLVVDHPERFVVEFTNQDFDLYRLVPQ